MASWAPDPKPPRRYRATQAEWAYLRRCLLPSPCVICEREPATELHHILRRSQGGGDVLVNLAPVCRVCHARLEAREQDSLRVLGRWVGAGFINYLASVLGNTDLAWAWIETRLLSEREDRSEFFPANGIAQSLACENTRGNVPRSRSENSKSAAPSPPGAPPSLGAAESGAGDARGGSGAPIVAHALRATPAPGDLS